MDRDFDRTPWEPLPVDENPRPRRSWKRSILILVVMFLGLPVLLLGARYLTISSVSGTVTFGTYATGCTLSGNAEVFPKGSTIYGAIVLERGVSPSEVVTVRLLQDANTLAELEFSVDATGMCGAQLVDDGALPPGHYRVTYSVGDELLADGTFEISASASPA